MQWISLKQGGVVGVESHPLRVLGGWRWIWCLGAAVGVENSALKVPEGGRLSWYHDPWCFSQWHWRAPNSYHDGFFVPAWRQISHAAFLPADSKLTVVIWRSKTMAQRVVLVEQCCGLCHVWCVFFLSDVCFFLSFWITFPPTGSLFPFWLFSCLVPVNSSWGKQEVGEWMGCGLAFLGAGWNRVWCWVDSKAVEFQWPLFIRLVSMEHLAGVYKGNSLSFFKSGKELSFHTQTSDTLTGHLEFSNMNSCLE